MIIFKRIFDLQRHLQKLRDAGKKIGFVPTMGALHDGHLTLIRKSEGTDDVTVCSIFVNPTQFNDKKDFEKYPITIENDIYLLEKEKTNIVFMPSVEEIYPEGLNAPTSYNIGELETILEGKYRPGHFQGVCRVMHKLLNIVQADDLFMGQKDYQQCMVIKKLMATLNINTRFHMVSTQREENGLAMSSRNLRLSVDARKKACTIYQSLNFIKNNIGISAFQQLTREANEMILDAGFEKVDYVEICDAGTLMSVTSSDPEIKLVALAAAFVEGVRLIDNILIN